MFEEDAELLADFQVESREGLAEIETDLLSIEETGAEIDVDLVNKVFRAIHSIKGAAGFLGLETIGSLAHSMENVLSLIRSRSLVPTTPIVGCLLTSADQLRGLIENIESSNGADVSGHVAKLKAIAAGEPIPGAAPAAAAPAKATAAPAAATVEATSEGEEEADARFVVAKAALDAEIASGKFVHVMSLDMLHDVEAKNPVQLVQRLKDTGTILASRTESSAGQDGECLGIALDILHASYLDRETSSRFFSLPLDRIQPVTAETAPVCCQFADAIGDAPAARSQAAVEAGSSQEHAAVIEAPAAEAAADHAADEDHDDASGTDETAVAAKPSAAAGDHHAGENKDSGHGEKKHVDSNIRVSVAVLDRLMNLAGELVLGRNQLLQTIESNDRRALDLVANRIDQVTSELQETIMQTRMQPIGNVFNKFTRVVRDLSQTLGKQCQLEIEGKDVELDKTIIETIGDPLTHLVRNAVDHGMEKPDVRKKAGKNPVGTIKLSAVHQEGKVLLSISDDGAGIDPIRLKKKAVEKKVITQAAADAMSDREAIQLIFAPGFSTADQVTAVSGRGVGMDVVKTNFEQLGGSVEIDTKVGKGTTITVRLPLTLAIIPSLIASCRGQRYAIPQVNISELVRVRPSEFAEKIGRVNDAEVLHLRGALLPLVRLGGLVDPLNQQGKESLDGFNVVVVEAGRMRYGLVVDSLHDSEEIVVKPLGRHLKQVPFLAGATVLGDGNIALILDATGVANRVKLSRIEQRSTKHGQETQNQESGETISTLLFSNHPQELFGVPMAAVARIERIQSEQIEVIAGQQVLLYRGASLPLLSLEQSINARPREAQARVYVIVFRHGQREIGLIAPEVLDIREVSSQFDTTTLIEPGVMGSTIIEGYTARVLDVFELGDTMHSGAATSHPTAATSTGGGEATPAEAPKFDSGEQPTILLAEDSHFFRNKVKKFLESEGWRVIDFEDGCAAWEGLNESPTRVDLVVTDIEMPRMNGFEFCQKIRTSRSYSSLPVIALTSLAGDADRAHGIQCGITEHLVKLNRDSLISSVAKHLGVTLAH